MPKFAPFPEKPEVGGKVSNNEKCIVHLESNLCLGKTRHMIGFIMWDYY